MKAILQDFLYSLVFVGIIILGMVVLAYSEEDLEILVALEGEARIVDGDTIEISGRTIRFIDFDAPEMQQQCTMEVYGAPRPFPCGETAKRVLRHMAEKYSLSCVLEGEDVYGRALGRCYFDSSRDALLERPILVAQTMIGAGVAVDISGEFADVEAHAKEMGAGLWTPGIVFERPSDWRRARRGR